MALMNCPECGHEVSNEAIACPNCGRPLTEPKPTIRRNVVVADTTRDEGFPKWLLVPIVILGALTLFLLFALMRNGDDDAQSRNINVNVDAPRRSADTRDTSRDAEPNRVDVPSSVAVEPPASTSNVPSTTVPQTVPPDTQTDVTSTRGVVRIEAKVTTRTGTVQPVKDEKFYLLDEDLETILREADLEPLSGQTLANSFGLAVLYPDRYGDFQRRALNAINQHVKYDVLTDAGGKAQMKDVKPDSYYLFGITKTRTGFAIWNSPVTIRPGENVLNLSPARMTEISD